MTSHRTPVPRFRGTSRKGGTILAAVAVLSSCETVSVTPVDVTSLNVDPPEAVLSPGDTIRLSATPLSSSGEPFPRGVVTWINENPAVATVDGSGLVRAHDWGEAVIRAVLANLEGSAVIRVVRVFQVDPERSEVLANPSVLPADGKATSVLTIRLRDPEGTQIPEGGHEVTLSKTGGGTLTSVTDHGNGTYTGALAAPTTTGSAQVTVEVNGEALKARATVNFVPGPPSRVTSTITASPASIRVNSNQTSTVTVRLRDAQENPLTEGGDNVKLQIAGRGKIGKVTDHGDGSDTAIVTPPRFPGSGTVRGDLNGESMEATVTIRFTAFSAALATPGSWLPAGRLHPGSTGRRR
jgi:hypothetical protein